LPFVASRWGGNIKRRAAVPHFECERPLVAQSGHWPKHRRQLSATCGATTSPDQYGRGFGTHRRRRRRRSFKVAQSATAARLRRRPFGDSTARSSLAVLILSGVRRRNRRHDGQNKHRKWRTEPADPRLGRHGEPRFVIATIAEQRKRNCGIMVNLQSSGRHFS
jgi:hypothetical protein